MKYTDYKKVKELAKNILINQKNMYLLTADLDAKLKNLKASFQDDGIEEVEEYVKGLTAKLTNAEEAFSTIANELIQYADMLKAGKGK
ncbi:MAG: hypothetical protein E7286_07480 [Lachnospiraceae bacterium]|nr:hypothetical protein [Lachnospiraceae bacterium]